MSDSIATLIPKTYTLNPKSPQISTCRAKAALTHSPRSPEMAQIETQFRVHGPLGGLGFRDDCVDVACVKP